MQRYFRVFSFMFQVWGMIAKNKTLLKPILYNIAIAAPLNLALALGYSSVESGGLAFTILAVGITTLYFIDYVCAGLTVSLIHDQVTQGDAQMSVAVERVKKAAGGILIFAAISAALDILSSYAQERDDIVGKIITSILYAVWTTATFMMMPAMVLEDLSFGKAFSRSKEIMSKDPTNVGVGVVGMAMVNYVLGAVVFGLAYQALGPLSNIHPMLGGLAFFSLVNVYWALSGYLKISYYTCFYLWAQNCARESSDSPELAPAPLAAALAN
jgi:hypothetical protein